MLFLLPPFFRILRVSPLLVQAGMFFVSADPVICIRGAPSLGDKPVELVVGRMQSGMDFRARCLKEGRHKRAVEIQTDLTGRPYCSVGRGRHIPPPTRVGSYAD